MGTLTAAYGMCNVAQKIPYFFRDFVRSALCPLV